jgi:hypothetical protein
MIDMLLVSGAATGASLTVLTADASLAMVLTSCQTFVLEY